MSAAYVECWSYFDGNSLTNAKSTDHKGWTGEHATVENKYNMSHLVSTMSAHRCKKGAKLAGEFLRSDPKEPQDAKATNGVTSRNQTHLRVSTDIGKQHNMIRREK